MPDFYERVHSR